MRNRSFVGMGSAVLVLGLTVCALVPACRAAEGSKQVSSDQRKRIEAMRASGSMMRVGTFDSRAVAMAYFGSAPFKRELNELRSEYEGAKAAGHDKRAAELGRKGPALQKLMHKQGFGTWPVDNILEKIRDRLPAIAAQANVAVIVSKWAIVHQRSGVEFVDVTVLMVKPFEPDEKTQQVIKDIQKQKPVPHDQLK